MRDTRIFYGWWLMLATFAILFVGGGYAFYSFTVFMIPLEQQFGWTRDVVSGAASTWAICFGIASPLVGISLDRFGIRRTMAVSAAVAGAAYLFLSRVDALWMLYGGNFLAGGAVAGFTLVPAQTLMSRWFNRYRGRAIGLTMLGIGCGGLMFPPLANAVIERAGWSSGFLLGCAVLWLVVLPLVVMFVRNKPSDLGLLPDGGPSAEEAMGSAVPSATGVPFAVAVTLAAFWLFALLVVLNTFGGSAVNLHFVPFATNAGLASQRAANLFGLAVGFSIVGRLAGGFLADRFNPRYLLVATGSLFAASIAVLVVPVIHLGSTSLAPYYAFAPLYGLGLGTSVVITPVFVARCFGLLHFGRILGFINMGFALGVILGPILVGRLFVTTGSYRSGMWLCFGVFVAATVVPLLISDARTRTRFTTENELASTVAYDAATAASSSAPDQS